MKKPLLWLLTFSWALLIFYLTSIPNFKISSDSFVSLLISSGGHFFFFGVQAVLLHLAISQRNHRPLTLTALYALLDEFHQRTVPGRSADPIDWLLDTLGAVVFLYIIKKYSKHI